MAGLALGGVLLGLLELVPGEPNVGEHRDEIAKADLGEGLDEDLVKIEKRPILKWIGSTEMRKKQLRVEGGGVIQISCEVTTTKTHGERDFSEVKVQNLRQDQC